MIVHRCFAYDVDARPREPAGALWFPRPFQGRGRHDNPEAYGALYVSASETGAVAELLARFANRRLDVTMLRLRGFPLAVAGIDVPDDAELIDLDAPRVLARERLRPSQVATRRRELTQPQALALFHAHATAAGLRWWSIHESTWIHLTLWDRVAPRLRVADVRTLTLEDTAVVEAAELVGLAGAA